MHQPKVSVGIMFDNEINFSFEGNFTNNTTNIITGNCNAVIKNQLIEIQSPTNTYTANEFIFTPSEYSNNSFLLKDVVIGIKFHWERTEDQRFRGALKLIIENNKIYAINILLVEDYLTSVISSEMSATSSIELLKAHSVISRGWLLAQIERRRNKKLKHKKYSETKTEDEIICWYDSEDHNNFDVCADDHCQRYQGITKTTSPNVKTAINFTQGLVLMYDNKICDTRYYKSCGGVTETFENTWENVVHKYLSKVVDNTENPKGYKLDLTNEESASIWIRSNPPAFCNTNNKRILSQVLLDYDQETTDFHRWKVEYNQNELSVLIYKKLGIDFGNIVDLQAVERGVSGRIIKLRIIGTKKTMTIGKELEIRRILSDSHLYSSSFVVDKFDVENNIPQRFEIIGAGWGHGVGLCQIGAAVMGDKGYKYNEILLHYFKNAELIKIY